MKYVFILILSMAFSNLFSSEKKFNYEKMNIDSLKTALLQEYTCYQDSIIWYIEKITDELKPTATPDFDLYIKQDDVVLILLLDKKQNYIKPLLIKKFCRGHYRIFCNSGKLPVDDPLAYSSLIIIGDNYKIKKMVLMK